MVFEIFLCANNIDTMNKSMYNDILQLHFGSLKTEKEKDTERERERERV